MSVISPYLTFNVNDVLAGISYISLVRIYFTDIMPVYSAGIFSFVPSFKDIFSESGVFPKSICLML